jgi:hypothetical protein
VNGQQRPYREVADSGRSIALSTLSSPSVFYKAAVQQIKLPGDRGEQRENRVRPETFGHWITSSARSSSDCGIVRPSALAVLRLITNSNFVACSTGRSAGLAPLRILST